MKFERLTLTLSDIAQLIRNGSKKGKDIKLEVIDYKKLKKKNRQKLYKNIMEKAK